MDLSTFSYQNLVTLAIQQTKLRTSLTPITSQEKFRVVEGNDKKSVLHAVSYNSTKIRLLRGLTIEGNPAMKVLDFAAFTKPEYDLPIFCANFFTTPSMSIVVLDLNPLYDVTVDKGYKEKYYAKFLPLAQKHLELLPWGGKLTSESLRFFSPIVIWTKFSMSKYRHDALCSAFMDYFKAWLDLMDQAAEEKNEMQVHRNCEAQHKYLTWRAEKDPGYPMLVKLVGQGLAEEFVRNFLFDGVNSLGTKSFLDYFPEYECEDGTVNRNRSVVGKLYETRPWDANGNFVGG